MRIIASFRNTIIFTIAIVAFAALPLLVSGCGEEEGPVQPATFGLQITNKMPHDYDVYRKPSDSEEAFVKVGVAPSGATYRVNPLTTGTTYTFRLSRAGMGAEEFDFERTVSSGGGDVIWVVQ
jgi:hypothetical protein